MESSNLYHPPKGFSEKAVVGSIARYREIYDQAKNDPEGFWSALAAEQLHWFEKWTKTLEWESPFARWFVGGKTNMAYNCLDRHLAT